MNNTTLILDSSVIAKWFFPEEGNERALLIKEAFVRGNVSLVAPLLLYYEINNILKTASLTFRIDPQKARQVYTAFLQLDIVMYSSELLMSKALELALKYNISSYDASYVALAEYLEVVFLTADEKLLGKMESKLIQNIKTYDLSVLQK